MQTYKYIVQSSKTKTLSPPKKFQDDISEQSMWVDRYTISTLYRNRSHLGVIVGVQTFCSTLWANRRSCGRSFSRAWSFEPKCRFTNRADRVQSPLCFTGELRHCPWARRLNKQKHNPDKDRSSVIIWLCVRALLTMCCCFVFTCPLLVMHSKTGSTDAAYALQNLALLTPELAIPPVLEK